MTTAAGTPSFDQIIRTDAYLTRERLEDSTDVSFARSAHAEFAAAYDERFDEAIKTGGSIYADVMPPLVQAAHERRMALLEQLEVGDLSDKVVVDFGTGSWGVACIAPRLQACGFAIGIDVSERAIRESARLSAEESYPYGDRWAYLVSDGRRIDLHNGSVHLLFAGEVIEHVDHTDAWLDEVHRVLAPGGTFILTTPNADAALYRAVGEQWCVNHEHVALMGWEELRRRLEPRFEIVAAKGFNMSFHHALDAAVTDLDVARAWAEACEERPDLANGVVVQCRRRDGWRRPERVITDLDPRHPGLRWFGAWSDQVLQEGLTGRAGMPGASVAFDWAGTDAILQFWSHPGGGIAAIEVDGGLHEVDLYSAAPGFRRFVADGLPDAHHRVFVVATGRARPGSLGTDIALHRVLISRATL